MVRYSVPARRNDPRKRANSTSKFGPNPKSLSIKSIKSLIPLLDRVLVQRVKPIEVSPSPLLSFPACAEPHLLSPTQKTASGLFLPSASTSSPPPEALVIAVGPGHLDRDGKFIPVSVKEGDKVVIPPFGGYGVKVGDEVSRDLGFCCWRGSERC